MHIENRQNEKTVCNDYSLDGLKNVVLSLLMVMRAVLGVLLYKTKLLFRLPH